MSIRRQNLYCIHFTNRIAAPPPPQISMLVLKVRANKVTGEKNISSRMSSNIEIWGGGVGVLQAICFAIKKYAIQIPPRTVVFGGCLL